MSTELILSSDALPILHASELTFAEMMQNISDDDARAYAFRVNEEIAARVAYEHAKNPENVKIHATLEKARAKLATASAARFAIAANVSETFINRSERTGARYNVYSIAKFGSLALFVARSVALNAVNRACLVSLFRFADAEEHFTHKYALCATSQHVVCDARMRKLLMRHTVAASTASTQASSTMNALLVAGVCDEYRTEGNEVAYRLRNNALTALLRTMLPI